MWTNDTVQFARLIAEMEAAGAFTDDLLADLATSMDLRPSDVLDLKDRAVRLWEELLQHANPAAWIEEVFGEDAMRSTRTAGEGPNLDPTRLAVAAEPDNDGRGRGAAAGRPMSSEPHPGWYPILEADLGHLPPWLRENPNAADGVTAYRVGDDGDCLLYVELDGGAPGVLRPLVERAKALGCQYVFLRQDASTIAGVAWYADPDDVVHTADDGCVKLWADQLVTSQDDDDRAADDLEPGDTWVDGHGTAVEVVTIDDGPHPDGRDCWHLTLVRHEDGGPYDALIG